MFDDNCIVMTERFTPGGKLSYYKIEDSKFVRKTSEFQASSWVGFSNLSRNSSMFTIGGRPYVLGLSGSFGDS